MKLRGYDDLDIKPVGLNEQMTESSQRNAVPYDVHISLSEMPPPGWGDFFERAWRSQMSSMYRRAHISGQNIVIENCALNEVKGFKQKMSDCCKAANEDFKAWYAAENQRKAQAHAREQARKQEIKDLGKDLDFD
jgi:hypothetical protein